MACCAYTTQVGCSSCSSQWEKEACVLSKVTRQDGGPTLH